ncbi:LAFA_0F19658g1_1 [Lachancea sp. 'fantastica']|nr:LAFA_0F19658g1_1 [Lachancea sp. 'fantastica']
MSSEVSQQSNKRSISSTIASFFKKDTSTDHYGSDNTVKPSSITADFGDVDTTELPSVPDLVLYESKNGERPFLLPIMPVERLKILRQKQYLRHIQDSQLGQVGVGINPSSTAKLAEKQLVPLRSLKRRPLNSASRSAQLPRKRKFTSKTSLGKRWSGDFDYDLSEYDTVKKPKILSSVSSDDPTSSLESPRLSPSVLKRGTMGGKRVLSSGLSKTQENLLNGKSLTDLTSTSTPHTKSLPQDRGPEASAATKPFLALPSSGFDFVKSQEPEIVKDKILDSDGQKPKVQISLDQKDLPAAANKSFSFQKSESSSGDKKTTESPYLKKPNTTFFSFGASNDKPLPTAENDKPRADEPKKPISFSFGKTTNDQHENVTKTTPAFTPAPPLKTSAETEPDQGAKEPSLPNATLPAPRKGFTFGSAPKDSEPDASSAPAPKVSDASATKPAFNFGTQQTVKPTFNFGSKSSKPVPESTSQPNTSLLFQSNTPKSEGANKTPSFTFGETKKAEDLPKEKPFTFGAGKKSTEPGTDKPSTGFSFGAAKEPVESSKPGAFSGFSLGNKSESAPPESTSTVQKPSFSFKRSADEQTGAAQTSVAGQPSSTPAVESKPFSFGPTEGKDKSATPFSFGSTAENKSTTPTFSFGSGTQTNAGPQLGGGSGFKFDTNGLNQNINQNDQSKTTFPASSSLGATKPLFSFGSTSPPVAAPQPQQSATTLAQPPQNTGFNFGSGSTTSNNSPAFGVSANNQQTGFNFGAGNTTASSTPPPFGASNPSLTTMNPQSRPFSPSNTINMNFGGVASQPPSSIFGGGASTPAQIFGGQAPGTTGSFGSGGVNQNPAQIFGSSSTGDIPQQQSQTPMLNLPPGRKLARMRARRN